MSSIRIAFMGTPEFARFHLASLLDDPQFLVVGVVTQPDRPSGRKMVMTPSPVKKLALERNIPVITPENVSSPEALSEIKKWKPEAIIVVAYGQIVSQKFLDLFPGRVVNVHGSILPRWRGAAPIQRAIEAGDAVSGVTLQVMVKKMDAGAIIGKYEMAIEPNLTAVELHDRMLPLGAKLLKVDFVDYIKGNLAPKPQDEVLVTMAAKIDKSESKIDWQKSAQAIHNHVRAMTLGPGSFCEYNGKKLKLVRTLLGEDSSASGSDRSAGQSAARESSDQSGARQLPGQILYVRRDEFAVRCGSGFIRVLEVQPESRPRMKSADFLLGHQMKEGEFLK